MVPRNVALIAATGAAAVLGMVSFHASGSSHLPVPVVGSRAAAQAPAITEVTVKPLLNTTGSDDPWSRFEVTVPPSTPSPDMHVAFLVDGKGTETITEQPEAWPQSMPFKYRLDRDDDSRVKVILQAQGLPVKKNLITYHFAAGTLGWIGDDRTIHFRHGLGGPTEGTGLYEITHAQVGQKIVLQNILITDSTYKGNMFKDFIFNQWTQPKFAPKTPPGMVHHLVVYLLFTPHHGPLVKGHRSISQDII